MDAVPLWVIFLLTALLVLLSLEAGFRLGRWRRAVSSQESDAPVETMVRSMLALLIFILAFSFSLAASRYESRRQMFLDEVNTIRTAYLRAALLPEPPRADMRALMREYVAVRLKAFEAGDFARAIPRSEELHARLWSETIPIAESGRGTSLFIQSLNEMIDLHNSRVTVKLRTRIPGVFWLVLYVITVSGMASMGYRTGLASPRRSIVSLALTLTFAAVIFLIADLDRPQAGLVRVGEEAMLDLHRWMESL